MLIKIFGIIVVVVVLGAAVFLVLNQSSPSLSPSLPSKKVVSVSPSGGTTQGNASAGANLEADTQAVDTNLSGLDSDLSSLDMGINDKQGDLSEQ